MKPAHLRFYVDADLRGLGVVLGSLRSDLTYPGDPGATIHKRIRPPCRIRPDAADRAWIPIAAEEGWLAITRDSAIQRHTAEIDAVMSSGAKLVALAGADATTKWAQLEVVMTMWRRIEALTDKAGPFVYAVHRTSMRRVG